MIIKIIRSSDSQEGLKWERCFPGHSICYVREGHPINKQLWTCLTVCRGAGRFLLLQWILLGVETLITARCWLLSKGKFSRGNTQSVRITHAQFEKKISRRCRRLFPVLIPFSTSWSPDSSDLGLKILGVMKIKKKKTKPSYHAFRHCTNDYALIFLFLMCIMESPHHLSNFISKNNRQHHFP